jgi:hypothetical protein
LDFCWIRDWIRAAGMGGFAPRVQSTRTRFFSLLQRCPGIGLFVARDRRDLLRGIAGMVFWAGRMMVRAEKVRRVLRRWQRQGQPTV